MRHVMLLLGMGTSLIASSACVAPPRGPLADAAVTNAADVVRRLLAARHRPDESGEDGITPLMWAARYGAITSMTVLLDAGADANARDNNNRWTPLLHAVHKERPQAVRLLLERGADANAAAPGAVTPLMMAAADTDPSTVQALLEYGADPRRRAGRRHTVDAGRLGRRDDGHRSPAVRRLPSGDGQRAHDSRLDASGRTHRRGIAGDLVGAVSRLRGGPSVDRRAAHETRADDRQPRRGRTTARPRDRTGRRAARGPAPRETARCADTHARHGCSVPTVIPMRGPHSIDPN